MRRNATHKSYLEMLRTKESCLEMLHTISIQRCYTQKCNRFDDDQHQAQFRDFNVDNTADATLVSQVAEKIKTAQIKKTAPFAWMTNNLTKGAGCNGNAMKTLMKNVMIMP